MGWRGRFERGVVGGALADAAGGSRRAPDSATACAGGVSSGAYVWAVMGLVLPPGWRQVPRLDLSLYNDEAYNFRRYIAGEYRVPKDAPEGAGETWRQMRWTQTLWGNDFGNNGVLFSSLARLSYDGWKAARGLADGEVYEPALRLPALLAGLIFIPVAALVSRRVSGVPRPLGFSGVSRGGPSVAGALRVGGAGLLDHAVVCYLGALLPDAGAGHGAVAVVARLCRRPVAHALCLCRIALLCCRPEWRGGADAGGARPAARRRLARAVAVRGGEPAVGDGLSIGQSAEPAADRGGVTKAEVFNSGVRFDWWADYACYAVAGMPWFDIDPDNPVAPFGERQLLSCRARRLRLRHPRGPRPCQPSGTCAVGADFAAAGAPILAFAHAYFSARGSLLICSDLRRAWLALPSPLLSARAAYRAVARNACRRGRMVLAAAIRGFRWSRR
ncbi:MAG: hypothetical protein R3F11_20970 [Verrucomicrobiales bacterium]